MKNFIQPGERITAPAPAGGVISGNAYLIGAMLGIASTTQAAGESTEFMTVGVFDVPKVSAQAWTIGQRIYWDNAAFNFTTVVGSNTLVGVAVLPASNPSATGRVRLNGAF